MTACIGLAVLAAPAQAYEPIPRALETMPGSPQQQLEVVTGAREPSYCSKFQKVAGFADWTARVVDVRTSTINGAIDITFDVGNGIKLEQVMQKSNPLYPAVAKLKEQQKVRISGRFAHGNGECGYQMLTIGMALSKVKVIN